MHVFMASAALAQAVHATVSVQMARELVARGTDIACDVAVVCALARAGFGHQSIRALRDHAVRIAEDLSRFGRPAGRA